MLEKYKEAIELTNWIVWQMQYGDVQKLPSDVQTELKSTYDRLKYLFEPEPVKKPKRKKKLDLSIM